MCHISHTESNGKNIFFARIHLLTQAILFVLINLINIVEFCVNDA